MIKHKFGGIWTRKKLQALEKYLQFYVTALRNQPFTLHYADAFAGTGSHDPILEDGQQLLVPYEDFKGSVLTALEVEPGFHHYHFNDLNAAHVEELQRIRAEHPHKNIRIEQQDANQFVQKFCQSLGWQDRAVLFLDPYSTQLDWSTLDHVARSEKVDLWLLFPVSVILRMTPKDGDRVIPEWKQTLDRLLGTDGWQEALYPKPDTPSTGDLFGNKRSAHPTERINRVELQRWITSRLIELFPYVAPPLLLTNQGRPLFLFYFAVSNKSEKAWSLARKAANQIIKTLGANQI